MASSSVEHKLSSFLPPNLSVDGLYASLRHGSLQRPIAWSCKNMALVPSWVPDRKVPGLMNPSLRMFSLLMSAEGKARLWDTCMEDISMVHGQSRLTHVLWNPSGNYFTTIDEKGKIVIWANKYVATKTDGSTKYERERTGRPRSPMTLVVLTSDGQLTTVFRPAAGVYTHISTTLPRRSAAEEVISSRITHGSMMSSADGIYLVTHASTLLPLTVNLYNIDLRFAPEVVFRCDAVAILHISNPLTGPGSVMMPGTVLHVKLLPQTATRPFSVAVALASRDETQNGEITYSSQVVVWDVTPKVMGFHPAFQELSTRRNDAISGQSSLTFVMLGERRFENKFVSALNFVPRSRELIVGFSDGSVLGLESCFSGLMDSTPTLLDGFRIPKDEGAVVALSPSPNGLNLLCSSLNGNISTLYTSETTVYDLDLETLIQYAVAALLNDVDYSDIVAIVVKAARISGDEQLPDRFLEGVFKSYESIKGAEDSTMLEPFLPKASVMRRMLSLQLVLFQSLPKKRVQYRVTSALLHLQSIGEVFSGCCTSDPATLAAHLDPLSNITAGQKPLAFDAGSLWSLLPLCGWVLDFCTVLFRELAMFLSMKRSTVLHGSLSNPQSLTDGEKVSAGVGGGPTTSTGGLEPSILCFLYHNRARKTLRSVLVLMEQFHQFLRTREKLYQLVAQTNSPVEVPEGQGEKVDHTNSMSIPEAYKMKELQALTLSQYVEATFARCPLKVGVVKSMLRDLSSLGHHVDLARQSHGTSGVAGASNGAVLDKDASDHIIFIRGTIPFHQSSNSSNAINSSGNGGNTNLLAQAKTELRMITRRYPTLWDMNRLMFATIHWLDLEPADILISTSSPSKKTSLRERALAMHPARCRIDPVSALKTRTFVHGNIVPSIGGARATPSYYNTLLQHQNSNASMSSVSSLGSRGSVSGPSGGIIGGGKPNMLPSKTFMDSPGELPVGQQPGQQQQVGQRHGSMSHPFPDASSTMAQGGTGSLGSGGGGALNDLSVPPTDPGYIWGVPLAESDGEDDDLGGKDGKSKSSSSPYLDENAQDVKAIWQNWTPVLQASLQQRQHQAHLYSDSNMKGEDGGAMAAETVPDDDTLLEDEGDEDDEERDSDEDMQDAFVSHSTAAASSRRDSKSGSRRSSMVAALAPTLQWLLQESQILSKRTQSEWTVLPILNDQRPMTGAIAGGNGGPGMGIGAPGGTRMGGSSVMGRGSGDGEDIKPGHRLVAAGLAGHFAPMDLQLTDQRTYALSQTDIEAQVRKRRYGVDPIRKVKKYKTTGNGRRCIRCHQVSTNVVNVRPGLGIGRRPPVPHQMGVNPPVIPDIAGATLWYHNYDRSCICGGMWLEL
ncbi:hypothetical protein EDD11_002836 [Mortierella claussenii]|nr:hypothetical protein EDD11_002836 [Mortierella claussenii]